MRIVTYNLLCTGAKPEKFRRVLELKPDILLLQESPAPLGDRESPLRSAWCPCDGRDWGSAVVVPGGNVIQLPIREFQGWLVGADVEGCTRPVASSRPLRVFSVHAPPREVSGKAYSATVMHMLDVIAKHADGADLIIGGDFNLVSLGERQPTEQRASGLALQTEVEERAILQRLASEFGLVNCWQSSNPGIPLRQTLRWSKDPITPFHCDGIFVPAEWRSVPHACDILSSEAWVGNANTKAPSDHNPVVATFGQTSEVVLRFGAEGGGMTIIRTPTVAGGWAFHQSGSSMDFDENDEECWRGWTSPAYASLSEAIRGGSSNHDWLMFSLIEVHPEYEEPIRTLVRQAVNELSAPQREAWAMQLDRWHTFL